MKNVQKVLLLGFSILFGFGVIACDKTNDSSSDSLIPSNSMNSESNTNSNSESVNSSSSSEIHLNHDFKYDSTLVEATCNEAGQELYKCVCGESKIVNTVALGHHLVYKNAIAATCEKEGSIAYYHCERCTKDFADEDGKNEVSELTVAALNHDYQKVSEVAPTCISKGSISYVCTHDASHTYTKEIESLNHHCIFIEEEKATCLSNGIAAHYECEMCHQYFTDETGTQLASATDYVLPIIEHEFVSTTISSFAFDSEVEYGLECINCHERNVSILPTVSSGAIGINSTSESFNTIVKNTTTSSDRFVLNENGDWVNNNQGKSNSSAYFNLNFETGGTLEFDLTYSTESNYDKFYFDGTNYSGEGHAHLTKTFEGPSNITLYYAKDGSTDRGSDTVTISNLKYIVNNDHLAGFEVKASILKLNPMVGALDALEYVYLDGSAISSLPTLTRENAIFTGWYLEENYQTLVHENTVLTGTITLYAKWGINVSVTVMVDGNSHVVNLVSGTPVTLDVPQKEGYYFAGWFTTATFEADSQYHGENIEEDTTLYACLLPLPSYVGSYSGINLYGRTINGTSSKNKTAIVANDFSFTTNGTNRGIIVDYDQLTHEAYVVENDSRKPIMIFEDEGMIVAANSPSSVSKTLLDFDIYIQGEDALSDLQVVWNDGANRLVHLTYGEKTLLLYVDSENYKVYPNIEIKNASDQILTLSDVYNKESGVYVDYFKVVDNGHVVCEFKYDDASFVALDGYQGNYEGNLGTIVVDGIGHLTINDTSVAYTIIDGNLSFVYANSSKLILVNNESYTLQVDHTVGTYNGEYGSFISTGYGNATLNNVEVVYVVSGNVVTISGETTRTIILNEDGTYMVNSQFSGHRFEGTFYSDWEEGMSSLVVVFANGATISGTMYAGYGTTFFFDFEATFENDVLTMTVTRAIDSSAVGKTIVWSYANDTLTVIENHIGNSAYTFHKQGNISKVS